MVKRLEKESERDLCQAPRVREGKAFQGERCEEDKSAVQTSGRPAHQRMVGMTHFTEDLSR